MNNSFGVPEPFSFNPLKHHFREIIQYVRQSSEDDLRTLITAINHNNIDIYSGDYGVDTICRDISSTIRSLDFYEKDKYFTWLQKGKGHQYINLDDGSVWILLKGDNDSRYIHIHPAKFGPYSIRYKGTTLKTVYRLISMGFGAGNTPDLLNINLARTEIGLSPIKRLSPGKGILKCWDRFAVT